MLYDDVTANPKLQTNAIWKIVIWLYHNKWLSD